MFDVLIIGHSLSDPDINSILKLSKQIGDPGHPIYLVAADFTKADEQELFEQYNIVLVPYSNPDGTHFKLLQILKTVDRFIVPRSSNRGKHRIESRPDEEVETAIAISLYRRLQRIQPREYLSPLILLGLDSTSLGEVVRENIASLPVLKKLTKNWGENNEAIDRAISELCQQDFLSESAGNVKITSDGQAKVQEYYASRKTEIEQAYGQFQNTLKGIYNNTKKSQLAQCQKLAEEVIVANFANRGLVIANKVFSERSPRPDELSDVFGYVSDKAIEIEDMELRAAFIEAIHQFIIEPNRAQRDYLGSVSQGYFLYHLLGLDPKCGEVRRDIFRKTLWLCDSSVILPRIAAGCHNHDYAVDLFNTLIAEKALLCTTPKLLQEAWEHFDWALRLAKRTRIDSLEFLRAALVEGSYKQNLFLDGYIRLSADGKIGTFDDYLRLIVPSGNIDRDTFEENITKIKIKVVEISALSGFEQNDWGDVEYNKSEIQKAREEAGTYRSQLQVESEAEILVLLRNLRSRKYSVDGLENAEQFYFISQSQIIDRVSQEQTVTTWSPEAIYRYLSTLTTKQINPDLLQQCMLHEYFYAGISFIDKERYEYFFGPSINAAKTSFEMERNKYVADLEDTLVRNVDEIFEQTPDLKKPFFTAQMGWQRARHLEQREAVVKRRAVEAEEKVKKLESEKEEAWRTREKRVQKQEEARRRNLENPKHVRKRQKQRKKRERKKK